MATMPRERFIERAEERAVISTGTRPVVGWSGVFAGLVVGAGVVGLLSVLDVAVGITVWPDGRMASGEGGARLGIGTGVWAALSLLVGFFVGGLVSTRATNHTDRGGAVIQGTLVWILGVVTVVALVMSGISALALLTRGAIVSSLATATGTSTDETARALDDLRARIAPLRDDPVRVAAEVQAFFDQLAEFAPEGAKEYLWPLRRGSAPAPGDIVWWRARLSARPGSRPGSPSGPCCSRCSCASAAP